jgi:aminoglycoside 2''-phosphotransferase
LFSLHRRLPGQALTTLAELDEDEQRALATDLGDFLCVLHAVPVALLPERTTAPPSTDWHDLLVRCETLAFPLIAPNAVPQLRQAFRDFLNVCDRLPRLIVHGDFGTGNILVHEGRLTGVIDFSGCEVGDPAYDYASLAAGLGDVFVDTILHRLQSDQGIRRRMSFYRLTFPLLDILHGLEHDDHDALRAGVEAFAD